MNKVKKAHKKKKKEILDKIKEFKSIPEDKWLDEFIFCILTPQSNAQKCWQAILEINSLNEKNEKTIKEILKTKTRFHNNKTKYILENLKNWDEIKLKINQEESNPLELRNWLSEKIRGYGLKESAHFLRNIGFSKNKIAILDRHILKNLLNLNIIKDIKIKNKKDYLKKEEKFIKFSKKINIPLDELDLLFWSNENGAMFK